jgi:hypothetical protein
MSRHFCLYILPFAVCMYHCRSVADGYVEPDRIKHFHLTVNREDHTIKTEMLTADKNIDVVNEKTYLWYTSRKIMETKGGYGGKLIHGPYVSYYLNDQLREQGEVRYGLKHSTWKFWYPDGHLREIITYKNGIKTGNYFLYNDHGQPMARGRFKDDKLHGKFYTYGATGRVIEVKRYKRGVEVSSRKKRSEEKKGKTERKSRIDREHPENMISESAKNDTNNLSRRFQRFIKANFSKSDKPPKSPKNNEQKKK